MSNTKSITRPKPNTYPKYFDTYISLVDEKNLLQILHQQMESTKQLYKNLSASQLQFKYAPEKWSVIDVLQHIMDCERVFSYRILCLARFDKTNLPGFEENDYAINANADKRIITDMLDEYTAIRNSSIGLIKSLNDLQLDYQGTANQLSINARAVAFCIAGHEKHHISVLHKRYGI
jgi:hypothetical protein